jgi:hypothetical protein
MDWKCGSSGRAPAQEVAIPSNKTKQNKQTNKNLEACLRLDPTHSKILSLKTRMNSFVRNVIPRIQSETGRAHADVTACDQFALSCEIL